jgi:capsular exopolysaccharide synthesis family protein
MKIPFLRPRIRRDQHQPLFDRLIFLDEPQSATAEAVRALRTRIMAQHLASGEKAIALCAATANVGCSFIAANLAIACAQIGINTALVDTDIRAPSIHRLFGLPDTGFGLADHLAQRSTKIDACLQNGLVTSLSIVTAGSVLPNPQELLAAQRFQTFADQITSRFDLTIFDTPPASICTDAQRVATVVGHALIVARKHASFVSDVSTLSRLLRADRAKVVGSVMTVAD